MPADGTQIGYHASHEQFSPSELLEAVRLAEAAGFGAAMASDHFQPWSERQGQSGFVWSWLGAAMQATTLSFGTVNAPGQRYHPAIVAQAAATLAQLFPDRFWLALGTGEALNEAITGTGWPARDQRRARLGECVQVIRALLAGETVTHRGLVIVEEARLWTRPSRLPLLFGAALTEDTARWCGSWADGLITVPQDGDGMRRLLDAFREGGGAGKPVYLKTQVAFAASDEAALDETWDQWRLPFESSVLADLRAPAQFDSASNQLDRAVVAASVRVSSDPARHVEWLSRDLELGFERIFIHNVTRDQGRFIEAFGRDVLPQL